ncbi:maltodextrin-binding protein MdxE [Carnobacterium sp. 17-4]|uniref:extracellular solute-binding protein n=1 Tax=Carnobacterium sp. (strain 17-4) TaxID=208596 RepID=UPI00020589FD|nr:extracellular solute-binding protein [Carnobacterium sp. 17-4]AEB30056.1 maltodextrin-binding protein MdxE [Carnobacterium sp. 17-4]
MKKTGWKKYVLGLVSASALVLAACGGGEEATETSSTSGGEEAGGDTTLQISVDKGYVDYVEDIKGDFEEEHGVTIEVTERDMFEQLEALPLDGPSGNAPDIMMSAYDRMGSLGQQGHIAEVTLGNDDQYDDTDRAQVTLDGKIYGAPSVIETLVLYYNTDLLDAAPTTFADLEELAKDDQFAFEGEEGKNTGFLAKWTDFYFTYGLVAGYGGYVFGEDGTDPTDIGLNNEGAVEAIEYATDWFQNTWPQGMQDVTSSDAFITDQYLNGKVGAFIGGPWQAASLKDAGVNYGVSTIPTLNNDEAYEAFGGGKGWVVSNYSENKDVSQAWLDYVTNTENQNKFYDATNEVPANQESRVYATGKNDELTTAVINQYKDAQPMPNIPEMAEVWTGAENMLFDAASGNKTPQESADDSAKLIKESIEQKYTN